jgi:hypothetical protein
MKAALKLTVCTMADGPCVRHGTEAFSTENGDLEYTGSRAEAGWKVDVGYMLARPTYKPSNLARLTRGTPAVHSLRGVYGGPVQTRVSTGTQMPQGRRRSPHCPLWRWERESAVPHWNSGAGGGGGDRGDGGSGSGGRGGGEKGCVVVAMAGWWFLVGGCGGSGGGGGGSSGDGGGGGGGGGRGSDDIDARRDSRSPAPPVCLRRQCGPQHGRTAGQLHVRDANGRGSFPHSAAPAAAARGRGGGTGGGADWTAGSAVTVRPRTHLFRSIFFYSAQFSFFEVLVWMARQRRGHLRGVSLTLGGCSPAVPRWVGWGAWTRCPCTERGGR